MNTKLIWEKVYKGPFEKEEAEKLAEGIRAVAKPEVNLIHTAKIRMRRRRAKGNRCVCTAACGIGRGHNEMYDVFIKTEK